MYLERKFLGKDTYSGESISTRISEHVDYTYSREVGFTIRDESSSIEFYERINSKDNLDTSLDLISKIDTIVTELEKFKEAIYKAKDIIMEEAKQKIQDDLKDSE